MRSTIKFKKLHPDAIVPGPYSPGAVGFDVHAFCLDIHGRTNHIIIAPNSTRMIPSQIAIETSECCVFVCSRSGLAIKSVFLANAPGIIDLDYRGEIKVLLYNGGHESYYVRHEDRIAQLVPMPLLFGLDRIETNVLSETLRGSGGFGSTGR